MNEVWWEGIVSFLCKFWWVILLIVALALTAYFARDYWLPTFQAALGI